MAKRSDPPVVLIKWYDFTKWLLDRVDCWVQLVTRCVVGGYGSPERHFMRASNNSDVQRYFPSIDHGLLMSLVQRAIGDERLLTLIARILNTHQDSVRQVWPHGGDLFDVQLHKCGLPIGNLTSQFLANVYLDSLDQFVKHELRVIRGGGAMYRTNEICGNCKTLEV